MADEQVSGQELVLLQPCYTSPADKQELSSDFLRKGNLTTCRSAKCTCKEEAWEQNANA